jgi:hypothetical protein
MFNKENFEKRFLKSILKDHVRVTTENIVKLLINGVTGLFKPRLASKLVLITALIGLTACGGGGGGSSSATPTSSPKIIKISEGEKLVISETISVDNTSSNIVAVESKGDLELSSNIDMESENSVAINVKSGGSVVIGEDAVVTVSGDNSKAILVEGNSSATTIKSIGAEVETSATNLGEITISGSNSVGIEASGISTEIENTGMISINGKVSSGMVVKDGAIASNAGTISGTGDETTGIKAIGTETFATNSSTGMITVDGNSGYGMASEDSASIINEGTVAINGLNGYGMYSKSGSEGTNRGTINTTGDNSSGMYSSESGTKIVNDEIINVSGNSSIGMESLDGATAVNNNEINLNGISETGISGSNGSLISNAGTISGTGELITGVSILNSSFLNEGNIIVTGDGEVTADIASTVVSKGAIGVKSSGTESMATNSDAGTITVDGKISYGMIAEDGASIINEGNIVGNGIGGHLPEFDSEEDDYNGWYKGTIAMYSDDTGSTSENSGSIVVNGVESYGIVANYGSVGVNKGTIETNGVGVDNWGEDDPVADTTGGVGMYTRDGSITNEGTINSNGSWSKGMYAKGNGTATNTETININGDGSIGMYSRESEATVINNGEINVSGNNGSGMRSRDGATAINNEEINIIGNYGSGMFVSDGATAVNNNEINLNGISETGISGSNGSLISNAGTISGTGELITGVSILNSSFLNEGNIIVTGDGEVTADIASTVVSKGAIGVKSSGTESMATNSDAGTITVDGKISYGMIAEDGASIINEGNIVGNGIGGHLPEFDSEEDDYNGWYKGTIAMYSDDTGSTSENSGSIVVNGVESYGIVANYGSVGVNKGTIETNGNGVDNWGEDDPVADTTGGVGMYTDSGEITNEGTITTNGKWSKGMYVKYENGTGTNTGTINVYGEGSIGMYSRIAGATAINEGIINIDGDHSIGMRARDEATVINNGTINATLNKPIEQEDPENETTSSIFGMYGTEDSVIENNGDITVIGKDTEDYNRSFGINANVTASVTNTGDIYVSSIQSNVLGEGSANSAGINLDNVGEFLNSGSVTAYAEAVNDSPEAVGLDINNWDYQGISNAINSGSVEVSVLEKYIYSGLEEHYNYVDAEGVSLYGEGINFTTSEGGEIKVSAAGEKSSVEAVGIDADAISTLKNLGKIVVTSTNDGYKTIIGEYDDENGNIFSYENTQGSANATGISMYNVSNFENTGTINSTAENSAEGSDSGESEAVGIYAGSYFSDEESPVSLTGINSGKINVSATGSYGGVQTEDIYGDNTWAKGLKILDVSGSFINSESGEITVNAIADNQKSDAGGVYLNNLNTSENLSFENYGTITVTGDITHGVTASGSNVTASNYGEISIYGNSGYGMEAYNGATAINGETGVINLMGSNGVGMYATGTGSTIENRGTIYLSGSEVTSSDNFQTDWETTATFNGMDNKGNMGMKIENGSTMINKGKIVFGN